MNDLLKVRRGDVFFCKQSLSNHSSVENKSRPVVVVSNNTGNSTSTTCVVCPITTRDSTAIPVHVLYYNDRMTPQVVLCEQIKTVAINDLQTYLGYLSDEVMEKVDNALRIQLNLEQPVVDKYTSIEDALKFIESSFENLLNSKVAKQGTISESQIGEAAMKIAKLVKDIATPKEDIVKVESVASVETPKEKIEPTTPETKIESPESITPKRVMSQIDKFNARFNREAQTPAKSTGAKHKPTRGAKSKYFNSDEERREFLEDCNTLPLHELCNKWHMAPKDVYNHKYLCKRKLGL